MRMLFNRNDSYHHFIKSKILKSFLFNFPNWCCLRETCAYPHFPMWKHHECYLPLNIFSSWVFGFGPPQACILSLRTIRWQHTSPFWTPDPDKVTLMSWRSDGGCCHSRARADSPTHSRLTGIGYEALLIPNDAISTPNSIWTNKSHQLNFCDISASTMVVSSNPVHCTTTGYMLPRLHSPTFWPLRWRHNECDGISNHQPHDCLLNCLSGRRSRKTSKPSVTGLCAGNSPGTGEFPAQRPVTLGFDVFLDLRPDRWIPRTKASDAGLWCFPWSASG